MRIIVEVREDAEEWEIDFLTEAIDQCDATATYETVDE